MISEASSSFWQAHDKLPKEIQEQAKKKYDLWKQNPFQPSLRFKCVNAQNKIWSVRINDGYRAMGVRPEDNYILWYWIGDHDEYLRLIK